MKLRELFKDDIDRNINGVVKVEQVDDEAIVENELKEFVVTNELTRHFRTFYRNYNNSLDERTDKVGVWISGFFGSGKSHFLKMLSYLLENKEIAGKKTIEYFKDKFDDSGIYEDVQRTAIIPTETILFNIDSKSASDAKLKESGIVDVFLKVFNEKLGYSSEFPNFANIERYIASIGKYEDYKNSVCSKLELTWDKAVAKLGFKKDTFIKTYSEITGESEQSAKELFANATEKRSAITPENFAKLIKDYLDSKGPRNRLIFLVDEIGQFISDNTNLMLNLQTVVENLGSICNGRAWVMVTSQEAIDSITKERFRDQDFSKIQGRFDTKLSLSSSNTDEVIKRRLLDKTETAKQILDQHYNEQEKILANLITFSSQTAGMKSYEKNTDFIDCYPFVPYQFKLLQEVFSSLRKFSHAGAHLASGERSMLNAFHNALKEYGDKEVEELIPFNVFYQTIRTFIDTDIVRIIEQAKIGNKDLEDFDIEVLTVLFLTKYIKDVPCDIENLATLMISNINESKNELKSKIESALTRLKRATLIQQNGEVYDFLTNEEQDVSRGIKNTTIDSSDVLNEIYRNIYEEILEKRLYVTLVPNHTYYYTGFVDNIFRGKTEDIEVKFLTSMNPDYKCSDKDLKLKCSAEYILLIKLKDNGYMQELETVLKTDKYIKQKNSVKQTEIQDIILKNKGKELLDRKRRIKSLIEQAILESTFYSAANILEVSATTTAAKVNNAVKQVAENTYRKLTLIKEYIKDDKEIYAKLSATQTRLTNPNSEALKELLSHLQINNQINCAVTMQSLKNKYTKKSYGWTIWDIAGLVADLVNNNEITINYNGVPVQNTDKNLVRYLTNDRELQSTEIKIKKQIDSAKIQQVILIAKDLFNSQDFSDDGEKLAGEIKEKLETLIEDLTDLKIKHNNPAYPNKSVIDSGLDIFKELKTEPDVEVLFDNIIKSQELLQEWNNNYRLLKSFFSSQKPIFDNALSIKDKINNNTVYLDMLESPKQSELMELYKQITEIVELERPYSRIKDLPMLVENANAIYNELLKDYKDSVGEVIHSCAKDIAEEATKNNLDTKLYADKFAANVTTLFDTTEDFGKLSMLKQMAQRYSDDIFKQIYQDVVEKTKQQQAEITNDDSPEIVTSIVKELVSVNPTRVVNSNQILETEEDVDNYINRLAAELKQRIRANKRIKLQG